MHQCLQRDWQQRPAFGAILEALSAELQAVRRGNSCDSAYFAAGHSSRSFDCGAAEPARQPPQRPPPAPLPPAPPALPAGGRVQQVLSLE